MKEDMASDKSQESTNIRAVNETDRSADFKAKRAKLLSDIDDLFETKVGDRQFKFGGALLGRLGIERTIVDNPFGGHSLLSESVVTKPGL